MRRTTTRTWKGIGAVGNIGKKDLVGLLSTVRKSIPRRQLDPRVGTVRKSVVGTLK